MPVERTDSLPSAADDRHGALEAVGYAHTDLDSSRAARTLRRVVGFLAAAFAVTAFAIFAIRTTGAKQWQYLYSTDISTPKAIGDRVLSIVDIVSYGLQFVGGICLARWPSRGSIHAIRAGALGLAIVILGSTAQVIIFVPSYRAALLAEPLRAAYTAADGLHLIMPTVALLCLTSGSLRRRMLMSDESTAR